MNSVYLRLAEAIAYVRSKQQPDGKWLMDWAARGRRWFDLDDGPGKPSRWLAWHALRVLKWWDEAQ